MLRFATWTAPLPGGETSEEQALTFDGARNSRLLILPALFDEANKLRRQTVEVMRRLDQAGVDSFLPDLPGCNDSPSPLCVQTMENWREGADAAAVHFGATHLLTIRGGALIAPPDMPGWRYAPTGGKQIMRSLLRARTIAAKEAGLEEKTAELELLGRKSGIELSGLQFNAEMFGAMVDSTAPLAENMSDIAQNMVGGAPLWLRAEPDENPDQADALSAIITIALRGAE